MSSSSSSHTPFPGGIGSPVPFGALFTNASDASVLINQVTNIRARNHSEARELFFWAQRQYEYAASQLHNSKPAENWLVMSRICVEAYDELTAEGKKVDNEMKGGKEVDVEKSVEKVVYKYMCMIARKIEELEL
jgi:hypothetical protein